jgi:opacity protein-like surface antigen
MKIGKILAGVALLSSVFAAPVGAADDLPGPRPGISIGGRAAYYKPNGATDSWFGGAQLRMHFTKVIAVEGSADYRQNRVAGTTVDVYPVQASLLLYLLPNLPVCPYILGGAGWYFTHTRTPDDTDNRFGPHAGGGVQVFFNRYWSVDGSYRYLWNQDVHAKNANEVSTRNFSDEGHMATIALNYHF